jgi:DNA-binding CsgD family transcriptional regulator
LLGIRVSEALGRHCYDVLAGRSPDGAVACGPECEVRLAARRGRAPAPFLLQSGRSGTRTRHYSVGIIAAEGGEVVTHVLRPLGVQPFPTRPGLAPPESNEVARSPERVEALSRRQRQVLQLLMTGASTREIADALSITYVTVRNHIRQLLNILHVHSRLEATVLARKAGLDGESVDPPTTQLVLELPIEAHDRESLL